MISDRNYRSMVDGFRKLKALFAVMLPIAGCFQSSGADDRMN